MCKCCEEIEFWIEEVNKEKDLFSQIVIKNKDGRGRITTQTFALKYCPECGREL